MSGRIAKSQIPIKSQASLPPEALVARMAETFRDSGGNIRRVLETLFASPEFAAAAGRKHGLFAAHVQIAFVLAGK